MPVGTTLDLSIYAVHRDAAIFPAPHAFCPGRWLLPSDSEEVRLRGAYSFMPFLAGPRNCIGQKFAMQVRRRSAPLVLRERASLAAAHRARAAAHIPRESHA